MELFGKEIDINLEEKNIKMLILVGTIVVIVFLSYIFIISSLTSIVERKSELKSTKANKEEVWEKRMVFEKRYEKLLEERELKKIRLEGLLEQFKNQGYKSEPKLRLMVQDFLDYLDIELLEIGKTEVILIDGTTDYKKKLIPYTVVGDGRAVSLFFYYLENSKALVSLKRNRLEITKKNVEEDKRIEVKFKLGYYNIIEHKGGEANGD